MMRIRRPVGATSARGTTPAQVAQTNPPLRTEKQPGPTSELNGQGVDVATSESSASSTTRAPEGAGLWPGFPRSQRASCASAAAKAHVASVTPIKKRAMTKPNVTRRYASRHESLGLVPGEYSRRRSADEYRVSGARGGYYRESRHARRGLVSRLRACGANCARSKGSAARDLRRSPGQPWRGHLESPCRARAWLWTIPQG